MDRALASPLATVLAWWPEGGARALELRVEAAGTATGDVGGLVAIALEASEPERADRDSTDREHRLAVALEAGKMGTWEWLITENRVLWSPAIERMHGIAGR